MMNWLSNNWASLVVGLVVAAVVLAAIVKMIRDKKQNKSTCGCSCSGCAGASSCHNKGLNKG
ncbi:MAG: FeoB-associated Cys-rich membrane protein [Eubacteriales bacterium]|nr:FeoB-associated Cys-rich membrane protein [Eubacteriales bacterium]